MEWNKQYAKKLISIEDAVGKINSGENVFVGGLQSTPIKICQEICKRYMEFDDVNIYSALQLTMFPYMTDKNLRGHLNYIPIYSGPVERMTMKAGVMDPTSVQFHTVDKLIATWDKVICDVTPPDENGDMYFGPGGVCLNGFAAAESQTEVIVSVNKNQIKVHGSYNKINIKDVDFICESDTLLPIVPDGEPSDIEVKIASLIEPYIEDGSTLQLGIGGISSSLGYALEHKKDISVRSEMISDSIGYVASKGALKDVYGSFALGGQPLMDFVNDNKDVKFAPLNIVNDPSAVAEIDNFISVNSCLMSDLTGQVASEGAGTRVISATGGQVDFVRGATHSNGGKSFICLPSVRKDRDGNTFSNIVPALPLGTPVTTLRTDIMYIVTEYGVADLYNKSFEQRAKAMIEIAHPDFREELSKLAVKSKIIRK